LVKRSEKLAKKLDDLVEYSAKPDTDTTLLLAFDRDYVREKKLAKEINFYDFLNFLIRHSMTGYAASLTQRDARLMMML